MSLMFNNLPMAVDQETPMSRTHQYRKVMKPLLERKRRARINKCLDELKDLMVFAIQAEGESITKLEKADVLELTVRHLHKLKRQNQLQGNPALEGDRYRSGYTACANEVGRYLASVPGVNIHLGTSIMSHLGTTMSLPQSASPAVSPSLISPLSINTSAIVKKEADSSDESDGGYNSGRDSTPSPISVGSPSPRPTHTEAVWRPF